MATGSFAYSLACECDPSSLHTDKTYSSCTAADWCPEHPYVATIAENGLASILSTDPTRPRTPHVAHIAKILESQGNEQPAANSGWFGIHFIGSSSAMAPTPVVSVAMGYVQSQTKSFQGSSLDAVCLATHGVALWQIATHRVSYFPWAVLCDAVRLAPTSIAGRVSFSCRVAANQVALATSAGTLAILRCTSDLVDISSTCSLPQSSSASCITPFSALGSSGSLCRRVAVGTSQGEVLVYDTMPEACAVTPSPVYSIHAAAAGSSGGTVLHIATNASDAAVHSGHHCSVAALHESGVVSLWPAAAKASTQPTQVSPLCPTTSKRAVRSRWLALAPAWSSHPQHPQVLLLPQCSPPAVFATTVDTTRSSAQFKHDGKQPVFPIVTGGYPQAKVRSPEATYWKVGQLSAFQSTLESDTPSFVAINPEDPAVFLLAVPRGVSIFGCMSLNSGSVIGSESIEMNRQILSKRYNFIQKKASRQLNGPMFRSMSATTCCIASADRRDDTLVSLRGAVYLLVARGNGAQHSTLPLQAALGDVSSLPARCGLQLPSLCLAPGTDLANSPLAHAASVACSWDSGNKLVCAIAWHILQRCVFVQLHRGDAALTPAASAAAAAATAASFDDVVLGGVPGTSAAVAWVQASSSESCLLGAVTSPRTGTAPIVKPDKAANPTAAAAAQHMSEDALAGVPASVQLVHKASNSSELSLLPVDLDDEPELVWGGPLLGVVTRSRTKGAQIRFLQWPSSMAGKDATSKPKSVKLEAVGPTLPGPNAIHWCAGRPGQRHTDTPSAAVGCLEYDSMLQFVLCEQTVDGGSLKALGKADIPRSVVVTDMTLHGGLLLLRTSAGLNAIVFPVLVPLLPVGLSAPPGIPQPVLDLLQVEGDASCRDGLMGSTAVCVTLPVPSQATSMHGTLVSLQGGVHVATEGALQTVPVSSIHSGFGRALQHLCQGELGEALGVCHSCPADEQNMLHDMASRLGFHAWCCLLAAPCPTDVALYARTHLLGPAAQAFTACWTQGLLPCLLRAAGGDHKLAQELAQELADEDGVFGDWLQLHML